MRMWVTGAACLAALGLSVPAFSAPKDAAEAKMVAAVEADRDRNVKLLEALVRVNSGTMNLAGVEQVGRMPTATRRCSPGSTR